MFCFLLEVLTLGSSLFLNGNQVIKIAPEVAIKMMSNDQIKRVVAADPHDMTWNERFLSGALAGATGQVRACPLGLCSSSLAAVG